jgi:hypothetical protein
MINVYGISKVEGRIKFNSLQLSSDTIKILGGNWALAMLPHPIMFPADKSQRSSELLPYVLPITEKGARFLFNDAMNGFTFYSVTELPPEIAEEARVLSYVFFEDLPVQTTGSSVITKLNQKMWEQEALYWSIFENQN